MKRVHNGARPHQILQQLADLGGEVRCDCFGGDAAFKRAKYEHLRHGLIEKCYVLTEEGREALANPYKERPPQKPRPAPPPEPVDVISSPPWPVAHAPIKTDEEIERVRADALAARNLT